MSAASTDDPILVSSSGQDRSPEEVAELQRLIAAQKTQMERNHAAYLAGYDPQSVPRVYAPFVPAAAGTVCECAICTKPYIRKAGAQHRVTCSEKCYRTWFRRNVG